MDAKDSSSAAPTGGVPVRAARKMPPGSVCPDCALWRHVFVHPADLPGSRWQYDFGCPCCESHVPGDRPLFGESALGAEDPEPTGP